MSYIFISYESYYLGHNGLLEYFKFEPTTILNQPRCAAMPAHHHEDYKWFTPSPWDTQENFSPTEQVPNPSVSVK